MIAENSLSEELQHHFVDFRYPSGDKIECGHEIFNRHVAISEIPENFRDIDLTIKGEPVIVALNVVLQGESDLPQKIFALLELKQFSSGEISEPGQFV